MKSSIAPQEANRIGAVKHDDGLHDYDSVAKLLIGYDAPTSLLLFIKARRCEHMGNTEVVSNPAKTWLPTSRLSDCNSRDFMARLYVADESLVRDLMAIAWITRAKQRLTHRLCGNRDLTVKAT